MLNTRVQELSSSTGVNTNTVAALRTKLWDLESGASEQQKELSNQASTIEQLEQV